ncbi:CorA family divalent cation transporter [Sulfitobacter guttiformis]|uniref:Zinc transporter n=1 Tax=Sulfitobacter guttiformis TaxID=74349 RepID=A0A420DR23_9RHOB|nr:CorA family divalent cation transporter [Sulfitobacter guttiformis]KIN74109.1 Magnesium transporter, CorA family protein [Sulfitobacter guttiformis KCTC 32187]RKE96726.1 zinc transporter [Sulfitobacter guttiformis]
MPICVFDVNEDGTTTVPDTRDLTGTARYRWWHFDLSDPQLPSWCENYLPDIPAGALLQPETRPRCDVYEDGLILNLRGINLNVGQPAEEMVSIRMWVTDNVIVTVRLRRVFAIDEIRQNAVSQMAPPTPSGFVTALVSRLTARVQEEVKSISKLTEFFEADLEDESTPIPKELTQSRRRVIRLRRYLDPQRAALNALATSPKIPDTDHPALRELANRTTMAVEELDALRDRLSAVQDDHDLDVARRQAHNSFLLSVGAGIFLPISFLTGVFGVNVGGMPGIDSPWAFTILCLVMAALALLLLVVIRRKKWL